jgi:hypothetical protein
MLFVHVMRGVFFVENVLVVAGRSFVCLGLFASMLRDVLGSLPHSFGNIDGRCRLGYRLVRVGR